MMSEAEKKIKNLGNHVIKLLHKSFFMINWTGLSLKSTVRLEKIIGNMQERLEKTCMYIDTEMVIFWLRSFENRTEQLFQLP